MCRQANHFRLTGQAGILPFISRILISYRGFMLTFRCLALSSALLLASSVAHSATQRVDFTLTSAGTETATGFITYDDVVVAADNNVVGNGGLCSGSADNSIDYQLTFTGGAADGVVFNKSDCSSAPAFCDAPDFNVDVNFFSCSAGGFTANGVAPNTLDVSGVRYTFASISAPAPAAPATPVPALPMGVLWILGSLVGLLGIRRLRKAA